MTLTDFDFSEQMEHREELHNLSGLLNEVVSVVQARSCVKSLMSGSAADAVASDDLPIGVDESTMITIIEANIAKLF